MQSLASGRHSGALLQSRVVGWTGLRATTLAWGTPALTRIAATFRSVLPVIAGSSTITPRPPCLADPASRRRSHPDRPFFGRIVTTSIDR